MAPRDVVQSFVQRWQLEVAFEEARRHLGTETQRRWSARAIARTTPALPTLFSLVTTLLATRPACDGALSMRQAAWYRENLPTFSDALAAVRRQRWHSIGSSTSTCEHDVVKVPRHVCQRLHEAACHAA